MKPMDRDFIAGQMATAREENEAEWQTRQLAKVAELANQHGPNSEEVMWAYGLLDREHKALADVALKLKAAILKQKGWS